MRIASVSSRTESLGLTRPYAIAFRSAETVVNVVLRLETDEGDVALGTAAPEPSVTGETLDACARALSRESIGWLVGRDVRERRRLGIELTRRYPGEPAARAAVDMALHDLFARSLGLPLVDLLGRAHDALPTSITIGIKSVAETLAEADEYVGRGFRVLKVKTGRSLEEDLERLARLRERFGETVSIRADANQGYSESQTLRFFREAAPLGLEFLEQPMAAGEPAALRRLPESVRDSVAADESLLSEADALALAAPPRACGVFNVKLMKCGGIEPALGIAAIARTAGIRVMWSCMDESVVSIAAALHAALAAPATRYLDLDGSFDLARDVADGGFVVEDGRMRVTDAPGLGIRPKT